APARTVRRRTGCVRLCSCGFPSCCVAAPHGAACYCLTIAGELAAQRPVFLADVVDHDVHLVRTAVENAAGLARQHFGEFAFLLDGTAFVHFDTDDGHGTALLQ